MKSLSFERLSDVPFAPWKKKHRAVFLALNFKPLWLRSLVKAKTHEVSEDAMGQDRIWVLSWCCHSALDLEQNIIEHQHCGSKSHPIMPLFPSHVKQNSP